MTRAGEPPPDYNLKILVIGDSGVGKTCLLTRFTKNAFDEEVNATVGVDFGVKTVIVYDKLVKLNIWDTAGQEKFRTLTSTFYRGVKGVILVYDVTRAETLRSLEDYWVKELDTMGTEGEAVKMVVANKMDKASDRQVTWQEGAAFAMQHSCLFVETSAKTNIAVNTAFEELILKILDTPSLLAEEPAITPSLQMDITSDTNWLNSPCYC